MTLLKKIALVAAFAACVSANAQNAQSAQNSQAARPVTEEFSKSVIYQILLPVFTQEGTIKKAQELLPHIKASGANVVYLCPVNVLDSDENREVWSKRQKASNTENPKNPYRIIDYYNIDADVGTEADVKNFVDAAHKIGLKVIFDLVYYHCGPNAVFLKEHPNFVYRNADGTVKLGHWKFPELNYENPELREYMLKNMEYLMKKFDIDGYRTDVEAKVPADFWAEGYKRISKIKQNPIMIAESERASAQLDAYDSNYSFSWSRGVSKAFRGEKPASFIREAWAKNNKQLPKGARVQRALDNHDTASDTEDRIRYEKQFGNRGMDAVQVLNYAIDGIPFLYNGNEIADDNYVSMFSTPKHGRMFVGWENALTDAGKRRMELVAKLAELRRANSALWEGETKWIDTDKPDQVLAFTRESASQKVLVVINARNSDVEVSFPFGGELAGKLLEFGTNLSKDGGKLKVKLSPYGYFMVRYQ